MKLEVRGISSGRCVQTAAASLESVDGVAHVEVLETRTEGVAGNGVDRWVLTLQVLVAVDIQSGVLIAALERGGFTADPGASG